ncbi:MAG: hypothetical protein HUJ84_02765 [Veillonella sp.]|nr:hypothetical protein [Veillonella sp.]MCF0155714.1 hypothetical protein [Veillonella sp.]
METIVEACKDLDYSWLPESIGPFQLHIDRQVDPEANLYRLFHYENELGWRWESVYDKEVEDYTVRVNMPLFEFVDISFVRDNVPDYWANMQARCQQELTKLLIEPAQNFCLEYKDIGLLEWDFSKVLPDRIGDFVRDIDPHHGIRMINGSYIICEYRRMDDRSGLILFFNMLRREFFAELRAHNYPEINHDLDATSVEELEVVLEEHLASVLEELAQRL